MNPLNNKKIPITRLTKWYDETDFALDIEMGREHLEGDNNFTVVLYQVDRQKTNYDDIYGETLQEPLNISDLKTISINLEDPHPDSLDYKKLSLPKLRSIVSEKGLASDASKLKKNELLKLLGAE